MKYMYKGEIDTKDGKVETRWCDGPVDVMIAVHRLTSRGYWDLPEYWVTKKPYEASQCR